MAGLKTKNRKAKANAKLKLIDIYDVLRSQRSRKVNEKERERERQVERELRRVLIASSCKILSLRI